MEDFDERMMELALAQARLAAQEGEIPVGAVLVRRGEVLAQAHNRREGSHDPTAHAEILCMREAARILGDWRLRDCVLYVTLEPCPMCAGAMVMSQLGECYTEPPIRVKAAAAAFTISPAIPPFPPSPAGAPPPSLKNAERY